MTYKEYERPPEIVEFIPHEGQKKIFQSKARFIFAMGGNRGGKTTAGCYWSYMGMQTPMTQHLIGANVYDQLNQSVLTKFFDIFPQIKKYYIKRDKMLILPNGSKSFFRSLDDPDLIKGLNLHSTWVDEGDGMSEKTWTVLRSRVATTGGKILITSSIYPSSWIYSMVYKNNEKQVNDDYELITWESRENPSFPQEEWQKLKNETDPITFAREYESKFVFASGRVYDELCKYGIIQKYPEGSIPLLYCFGLDFGVSDPTALIVLSFNSDGCWYIVDEWYKPNANIDDINYWIKHFCTQYQRPFLTVMDPAGGIARNSLVTEANAYDANKKLIERVTLVRNLIWQKKIFCFSNCTNTIRELNSYSFDHNNPNVPEADGLNHACDAFGMVIYHVNPMVEGKATPHEPEEQMNAFWAAKKEAGIYKGHGKLEDRIEDTFDEDNYDFEE